jgi:hypothetical protein
LNETVIAAGEVYVEPSGGRLLAVPVQNSGPKSGFSMGAPNRVAAGAAHKLAGKPREMSLKAGRHRRH